MPEELTSQKLLKLDYASPSARETSVGTRYRHCLCWLGFGYWAINLVVVLGLGAVEVSNPLGVLVWFFLGAIALAAVVSVRAVFTRRIAGKFGDTLIFDVAMTAAAAANFGLMHTMAPSA